MQILRYLIVLLMLINWAKASDSLVCLTPISLYDKIASIFKTAIMYNNKKIIIKKYVSTEEALKQLTKGESKFAVIRSDILYRIQNNTFCQDAHTSKGYIVLSRLPYMAKLYLVRPSVYNDIEITSLKGKVISIGNINESNSYPLKTLLGKSDSFGINFISETFEGSLKKIDQNEIDGFFGFLDESEENDIYHFQSYFTNKEIESINKDQLYFTKFNSIYVPYFVIASEYATDEEIETLFYRLKEKEYLAPITDERYGKADLYLPHHLKQVKLALEERYKNEVNHYKKTSEHHIISHKCMTYHYEFLKLLRKKPSLKKKIVRHMHQKDHKSAKTIFYRLENILISLDNQKHTCDLSYLEKQKKLFYSLSKQL